MTSIRRTWLWGLLVLWTLPFGLATGAVLAHPLSILHVGGVTLFAAEPWQLLAVWGLGTLFFLALLVPSRWPRWRSLVAWLVLLLAASGWAATRLTPRRPEAVPARAAAAAETGRRTTLLVGIDGISWTAILPLVRRGELPNFARLMEAGSYGVLRSVRSYREDVEQWGYWSPVVWTSIATGVVPKRHGITGFSLPDASGHTRMAASTERRAPAFWNLFSAFGRRVDVVGWWASWPAEKIAGDLVSSSVGLRGRRGGKLETEGLTYPPDLLDRLPADPASPDAFQEWVNRKVFPFDRYPVLLGDDLDTVYSVLWQDRVYLNAALYLIDHDPADLYAVYFEGTDSLSHQFWRAAYGSEDARKTPVTLPEGFDEDRTIVPTYYRVIDGYLGKLLAELPDDVTVLVCSDHGFLLDPESAHGADHSPYGVLIAKGPGIARGRDLNLEPLGSLREGLGHPASVLDVLPTLLYLHGLPIADDLDGQVLGSLLTHEALAEQPAHRVASYGDFAHDRKVDAMLDESVREEYQKRLKSLGYIQ